MPLPVALWWVANEARRENTCYEYRWWDRGPTVANACLNEAKPEVESGINRWPSHPSGGITGPFRASIGATGFEPATTCTPYRCATKLRYAQVTAQLSASRRPHAAARLPGHTEDLIM